MPNGTDINRRDVRVDLKDVYGRTITDQVRITFFNQRAGSLSQEFNVRFAGAPETLSAVPAFPFGAAHVEIQPNIYRFKTILMDIPAGDGPVDLFAATDRNDATFFIDPQQAAPKFPDYGALKNQSPDLINVLENPAAHGPARWWSAGWWNDPTNNLAKAGLLNLYAKMKNTVFPDLTTVFTHVREIWRVLPARLFSIVDATLLDIAKGVGAT